MSNGAIIRCLGRAFSGGEPRIIQATTPRGHAVAVAELLCRSEDSHGRFSRPLPCEEGYLVTVALQDIEGYELWAQGQSYVSPTGIPTGAACVYDLSKCPILHYATPFHALWFYFSREALAEAAIELGLAPSDSLAVALGASIDDPVIQHLGEAIRWSFSDLRPENVVLIRHVIMSLRGHLVRHYSGAPEVIDSLRASLAPWQERKAKQMIEERLVEGISIAEIAKTLGISQSCFVRSFKRSSNYTPHQWLIMRRIDRAIELMRHTRSRIGDIAVSVGFADQSHFNRIFMDRMGVSPGAWRRCHHDPLSESEIQAQERLDARSA